MRTPSSPRTSDADSLRCMRHSAALLTRTAEQIYEQPVPTAAMGRRFMLQPEAALQLNHPVRMAVFRQQRLDLTRGGHHDDPTREGVIAVLDGNNWT